MKRKHPMPFGAESLPDGSVRFRLWAPKPEKVDVLVDGTLLSMTNVDQAWFELTTNKASAGSRYRFVIDGGVLVPDPASRFQPEDVHGPSEVIVPDEFDWEDAKWLGRPWLEAVI